MRPLRILALALCAVAAAALVACLLTDGDHLFLPAALAAAVAANLIDRYDEKRNQKGDTHE